MGDINRDPSMEEILASIKRVISEETPPPPPRVHANAVVDEEEDVLELSDLVGIDERLVSEDTAAASRTKLAELTEMRLHNEVRPQGGDGPLEAAVREMLKPMLKQWLDQRLPEIVEELVKREITRITSGRE